MPSTVPVCVSPLSRGARDPEVGHLDLVVAADQDVLRLHVAMDDPVVVREREPVRDGDRDLQRAPHAAAAPRGRAAAGGSRRRRTRRRCTSGRRRRRVHHRHDVRWRAARPLRLVAEPRDVLIIRPSRSCSGFDATARSSWRIVGAIDARHAPYRRLPSSSRPTITFTDKRPSRVGSSASPKTSSASGAGRP